MVCVCVHSRYVWTKGKSTSRVSGKAVLRELNTTFSLLYCIYKENNIETTQTTLHDTSTLYYTLSFITL